MDPTELRHGLEAILFVSNEPVKIEDLAESFDDATPEEVTAQLEEIKRILDANLGGFILEQTAGGWRLATRAEHDAVLRNFFSKKGENRLSIAALETLAIVAYRQPVTAPEVSEIRGVNSAGVIRTLLDRHMVRVSGRKNVVGSPFLYRTTREFLIHFGLNDIRDLPQLEEFGDLIGENINEDLLAAISAAPSGNEEAEIPESNLDDEAAAALAEAEAKERAPLDDEDECGTAFEEEIDGVGEAADERANDEVESTASRDEESDSSEVELESTSDDPKSE
jgi:segregation and condensation protein B